MHLFGFLALVSLLLGFVLACYLFVCFCFKVICQKCGKDPGAIIWVPLLHFVPLIELAGFPVWTVILLIVPGINLIMSILLWAGVCKARGKSMLLVLLMHIPVVHLFFLPYLAFSE